MSTPYAGCIRMYGLDTAEPAAAGKCPPGQPSMQVAYVCTGWIRPNHPRQETAQLDLTLTLP
jgi:hypothetical protein